MFWKFVAGALRFRRRRLLLAFAALSVAAALATALFTIYADLDRKVREQFRGYGANLVIAPAGSDSTVPLEAVAQAELRHSAATPYLASIGYIGGEPVVLEGVDFARAGPFTEYWRVEGSRTVSSGECLAGGAVAAHFHFQLGRTILLAGAPCVLRGILSTGGAEENQILLPFSVVAGLAGVRDRASVVEVRADGAHLDEIRAALQKSLPGTDVRVARAVAETESNVASKVRTSVFLLTLVILTITTLCVTSNFSELVIERSREIGIMKAIGSRERTIAALFVSESAILAAVSTAAGYLLGLLVAAWIGRDIFAGPFAIRLDWNVLLRVGAVTLAVAALATLLAANRVLRIDPATVLRDE
ncbi:MAG: FtsX-like permease family protein [Acidobacteriota bacterium]|nr:FtsX-like permease family protein [Acidobacteriota bacterium]